MKNTLSTALIALALASLACRAGPAVPAISETGTASSGATTLMDFELASLDGGTFRPADASEELILIDFWATWCGPCHLQADILAGLYPDLKRRGVEFLAISLGEPEALVRDFVSKRPFAYPVLVDPNDYIATNYGLFILPTVVVLDREGTVLYLHEGISTARRLTSAIDEIIEGRQARSVRDNGSDLRRAST